MGRSRHGRSKHRPHQPSQPQPSKRFVKLKPQDQIKGKTSRLYESLKYDFGIDITEAFDFRQLRNNVWIKLQDADGELKSVSMDYFVEVTR